MNYYNEFDSFAADWLENLIAAQLIPAGTVDRRSIKEVQPDDLEGFTQCHFFAGIGGWSEALRLAGWDGPCWTGSCPCQPFSNIGKRKGTDDERHLWPDFFRLIAVCKPATIFGEQVASKAGREWLAGVFADLESVGYAVAGADLCAAGIGAPHIRQRLWWVAHADVPQPHGRPSSGEQSVCDQRAGLGGLAITNGKRSHRREDSAIESESQRTESVETGGAAIGLADSVQFGRTKGRTIAGQRQASGRSGANRMGNTDSTGLAKREGESIDSRSQLATIERTGGSPWANGEWLECSDGKARRVESGIRPLAHGVSRRMGKLRGFGNAIVPAVAATFIQSFLESVTSPAASLTPDKH